MTRYAIYFHQQWVGDHPAEWFQTRVEPSKAVVRAMEEAGVLVFAGGLEENLADAFSADATSGTLSITDGPYTETAEYLGGITVIDVPDRESAKMWAGKVAQGCGWPQEVRVIR
ncbi:MAG: YciI family protein [Cellulomonas sp.]|uniref:YciI family protein n=1 Tax=Cellulomonas sp. TaxID=40001 RepID=UPI00258A016B|nr:YciI family protein [Cellulomonas sp.]MCR6704781.1 YciI family protein [Cellulomonas sp.]